MAFDGATLYIIKNELQSAVGSRIEKITMPDRDRIILWLSARGFSKRLLISCDPSSPRINYTEQKFENPPTPPMFCMLLRKRLVSGRLLRVRQAGIDRILMLDFECRNELGDEITLTLTAEIMGRLSNIILVQDGKIIDCARRFDPEQGKRFMLPGAKYELPPSSGKVNILDDDISAVTERLKITSLPLGKALGSVIDGISPIIAREIAHQTLSDPDKPANKLNRYEYNKLESNIAELKNAVLSGGQPIIIYDESGEPKDFTFIPITQYGKKRTSKSCGSISEMIDEYYCERDTKELLRRKSAEMFKLLERINARIERKLFHRKNELLATKGREKYRIYGELVKANIHNISPGDSSVTCINYYDEDCKEIKIPLDVTLSASKNAQKYFNEYRKLSNAAGMLDELIAAAKEEQKYIESVLDELARAKNDAEIAQIKEELIASGYIKPPKGKRQKPTKAVYDKYLSSDGFEIFVGKNNRQNDELTTKIADKTDIWLHTKDIPGSHIIIRTNGGDVPESTYIQAAYLAAKNSKAAAQSAVPVDYTPVKYVKKPSGAKPGMVIYTTNKTIFANPLDDAVANRIRKLP